MPPVTLTDLLRRGASILRARHPRIRIWKIDALQLGYVSIPKAASSSIRNLMTSQQAEHEGDHVPARMSFTPRELARLRENTFLFSFVRNPLTRLYSCYRDKVINAQVKRPRCTLSPYRINYGMSFEEFVRRVVEIPDNSADQHFRSLSSFLVHEGQLQVDYVGRFEQFDNGWEVLSSKFALQPPPRNRRVSGPPAPISEIPLSKDGLGLIIKHYAQDLDTFGYREELESLAGS